MARLKLFKKKLDRAEHLKSIPSSSSLSAPDVESMCKLHSIANCKSCHASEHSDSKNDDDDDAGGGFDWMSHKLSFEKDKTAQAIAAKDARNDPYELVVIDPRKVMKSKQSLNIKK